MAVTVTVSGTNYELPETGEPHWRPSVLQWEQAVSAALETGLADLQTDAFGRLRVSNPTTLFDSKQIVDARSDQWDDVEASGTGTSSTFSADNARSRLAVSATTAGKRTRQTRNWFNYQPGKSQLIFMTGVINVSGGGSGIVQCLGQYTDDNGVFFKYDGQMKVVRRTNVTGSPVDNERAQVAWNVDTFDGTGPSGKTVDWTKTQIFVINYEWLGVGNVIFGLVIDGILYPGHQINNANNLTEVYMSSPNLPLRYEIENDGTGGAASMDAICSSIISEGGEQRIGRLRSFSTGTNPCDANSANSVYAVLGIRLKAAYLAASVFFESFSMINEQNDDFRWLLCLNPTVDGTFTYADLADTAVQTVAGDTPNTVSDTGIILAQGYALTESPPGQGLLENARSLGSAVDGTPDEVVLCVMPRTSNADILASINWREVY